MPFRLRTADTGLRHGKNIMWDIITFKAAQLKGKKKQNQTKM
ncbi:MAG: hypothetical protein U5J96_08005 [Ignavibacteriaceae bacterium]|nr:hypothetical protein [Ignavibacteriaceae bacterium]